MLQSHSKVFPFKLLSKNVSVFKSKPIVPYSIMEAEDWPATLYFKPPATSATNRWDLRLLMESCTLQLHRWHYYLKWKNWRSKIFHCSFEILNPDTYSNRLLTWNFKLIKKIMRKSKRCWLTHTLMEAVPPKPTTSKHRLPWVLEMQTSLSVNGTFLQQNLFVQHPTLGLEDYSLLLQLKLCGFSKIANYYITQEVGRILQPIKEGSRSCSQLTFRRLCQAASASLIWKITGQGCSMHLKRCYATKWGLY
jgi:hypothetical protein